MSTPRRAAPERRPPEPLDTDDVRALVVGTAMWVLALVVLLIRSDGLSNATRRWVWVAVAGVFLGAVALRHVRRRQHTLRNQKAFPAEAAAAAPKEPFT